MSYLLEIFGKGLIGSLWSVFGERLRSYQGNISSLKIQFRERPEDPELLLKLAVSYYREGNFTEAWNYAEKLLEYAADSEETIAIAACIFERLGQKQSALDLMETYVEESGREDGGILFAIGFYYEMLGDIHRAEMYYQKSLQVAPTLCNAHQRLAAIKFRNGDVDSAASHYRELCKIDPEDVESRIILAGILLNAGKIQEASTEYQIALTIEPDNWAIEDKLVDSHIKSGRYEEAIQLLLEAIEREGEFPELYLQLAELYGKLGQDEDAEYYYKQAIKIHPGYLEAMIKYGTYQLRKGKFLACAELFSKAIDINDRLLTAYTGLAIAQHYLGLEDKSVETIELAEAIEPNTSILFAEVAKLELKASAFKEASEYLNPSADNKAISDNLIELQTQRFKQALAQYPERADWHYRLGLLLKAQNKLSQSAEEFRKAIEINPDYVKARIKLGLVLKELGEKEEAIEHLKRAVLLEPGYSDVYYQLGLIYADQSQYKLAVEHFQESLKRNGKNINALAALAQGLINLGVPQKAKDALQTIIEIAPNSEQAELAKQKLTEIQ